MFSLRFMPRGVSPQQCRLRSALVTEQQLEALLASPEFKRLELAKKKAANRRKLVSYVLTCSVLVLLAVCSTAGGLVFISAANGGLSQVGLAKHICSPTIVPCLVPFCPGTAACQPFSC